MTGPRFSTRPALTTSETELATSDGSRLAGDPGADNLPPAGQRCMSTSFSVGGRYSILSKTSSSLVALGAPQGCMIDESIWDAAPSHLSLASPISFSLEAPLNTTMRVEGRCLSDANSLSSPPLPDHGPEGQEPLEGRAEVIEQPLAAAEVDGVGVV